MKPVVALALALALLAGCGDSPAHEGDVSEQARAAIESFGDGTPVATAEPETIDVEAETINRDRVWDTLLGLGVIAALIGLGYLVRSSAEPGFKPLVFAGVVLAVLMLTIVNPVHWEFAGARVDRQGIQIRRHAASDVTIAWGDVASVRLDDGSPFPYFADDRGLVFQTADGEEALLPRFAPRAAEIAAYSLRRIEAARGRPGSPEQGPMEGEDMSSDVTENAAALIRMAESLLDELIQKVDDESVPATERMASAIEAGGKIEEIMGQIVGEGLTPDHPALAAVTAKVQQIGAKLEGLAKQGAAEVAAAVASPPPPSDAEMLGREAAKLEGRFRRAIIDAVRDRPEADEALRMLQAIRDEYVRQMFEVGKRRAALDAKGKRDFQWGLVNEAKDLREGTRQEYHELELHYQMAPGFMDFLMEIMNLSRFANHDALVPADQKRLDELGLK